ncbi:MAG: prephenate dehydrogenase/arogenate dehydrogenase family protein [Thaumarchaeota archaeon]|nr:prephenate dehydrogenase/arogenate dehydrogenase family protein [Nitrososphaerota archaeon]
MRITVVGGCGSMGRWIVNQLLETGGFQVTVADPDEIEGLRLARTIGVNYEKDNKRAAAESDIVIVSVPVENTPQVIAEVAPCMKEGSLLMDIASVKTEAVSAMLKHAPQGVELVSLHPMFGPRIRDVRGQVVILIPVRTGKWFSLVKGFLEKKGFEVVETSVQNHDRMMSIVQGLTHFTSMVFAGVIREMNIDLKQSRRFSSPVYNVFLPIVYRVICQNPELYAQLQVHNPHVLEVQEEFITQAVNLYVETKTRNVKGIVEHVASSCRHFASTESSTTLLSISDRMVSTMQRDKNILESLVGRKVCLENVQTGRIHVGVLKSISADTIEIEESRKKTVSLSLFNVMLLDEKATMETRRSLFGESSLDFSVMLPAEFEHEFCREILERFMPEASRIEVLETYVGEQIPKGFKSVTIRVYFPRDEDPKEIRLKTESLLKKLGGRLR